MGSWQQSFWLKNDVDYPKYGRCDRYKSVMECYRGVMQLQAKF